MYVKPKKQLGQHFLIDEDIAYNIVDALTTQKPTVNVVEVGGGTGVLTKYLVKNEAIKLHVIDIDTESINYLQQKFDAKELTIIEGDFLQYPFPSYFKEQPYCIIGNFPYHISTQIMFNVLDNRDYVPMVVGMFQKEVAVRLAAKPGNRDYGIQSVLLQAYYDVEYLFTVSEHVFDPPPKVKSGVIRVVRNLDKHLQSDYEDFKRVIKVAFNQRRKTLRNALKSIASPELLATLPYLDKRAEQLTWQQFDELTGLVVSKKL